MVWAGDADWICNWFGNLGAANAVSWSGKSTFATNALTPYMVNGAQVGTFKTLSNFSFARIFGAGLLNHNPNSSYISTKVSVQVMKYRTIRPKPLFKFSSRPCRESPSAPHNETIRWIDLIRTNTRLHRYCVWLEYAMIAGLLTMKLSLTLI